MRRLEVEEIARLSPEAFRAAPKLPVLLALDNVRSMNNVGALLRTADAFRLHSVLLGGFTPAPPHREIHKTALGAEDSVDWQAVPHLAQHLQQLAGQGWQVVALEHTTHSQALPGFVPQRPPHSPGLVLVVGHEVEGVQPEVLQACSLALEIPQYGTKHSLNVSVAAGIALYALALSFGFAEPHSKDEE